MDRAERLAKEIEGTASRNIHVQEERGQVSEQDGDWDEEDKYSGVGIVGKANAKEHKQQIGNVGNIWGNFVFSGTALESFDTAR